MVATVFGCLMAAITLDGVTGRDLSVRSQLDAHNVRLGDPLVLVVDFFGAADFSSIHPPALAQELDPKVWRVDDASARTETYRNARRMIYTVRPAQEGVITFPALTFSYQDAASGRPVETATLPMPLHVRPGSQIALVADRSLSAPRLPQPDGLLVDLSKSPWHSEEGLSADDLFAWERACAAPTADAFAPFDFPEGRLNEAACAILEGDAARALRIYSSLDREVGQFEALERGWIAALALKTGNPSAELPMWRQVLRPFLRQGLWGRVAWLAGALLLLSLIAWGVRRLARAMACLAVIFSVQAALAFGFASDPMAEAMRMMQEMERNMQTSFQMSVGPSGSKREIIINGQRVDDFKITPSVKVDRAELKVGEPFAFEVSLDVPRICTITDLRLNLSQSFGLTFGRPARLADEASATAENVIRRFSIPARYDVPFSGNVDCQVSGSWVAGQDRGFPGFGIGFNERVDPIPLEVKLLSDQDRPADFAGAVGARFRLSQRPDRTTVATNDVVKIEARLSYYGYVPPGAIPGGIADDEQTIIFTRYFVADGSPETDPLSLSYYDVQSSSYRRVTSPGIRLTYHSESEEEEPKKVVVNAKDEAAPLPIRFAPQEGSSEVALVDRDAKLSVTERKGPWVRVDDGRHAGWIKEEDLP